MNIMERYKELVSRMTRQGWVVIIGSLVIAATLIAAAVYYSSNSGERPDREDVRGKGEIGMGKSREYLRDDTDKFVNDAAKSIFEERTKVPAEEASNEYAYDATGKTGYASWTQEVNVGLIIEQNEYDLQNVIAGKCGDVYMVKYRVPGPAVLENSIRALFGDKVFGDFLPGNIIPSYHPNLSFRSVVIEGGIAKIHLDGSFSGTRDGFCDAELAIAQLAETAKSHLMVKGVEIYQGSKKVYTSKK
jgi:hypothetical protein